MKFIIETEDETEMKRLLKSTDMASFIFELKYNAWREFKETDYDYTKAWNVINELLKEYNIDIDDIYN